MELHDLGPVKLFDTAGLDEDGELGAKKRSKVRGCAWVCLRVCVRTAVLCCVV
jgi:hypothetical protein